MSRYLLLHLHVFKDGVHPPGLGEHGSEGGGVADDEDPRANLSGRQAHGEILSLSLKKRNKNPPKNGDQGLKRADNNDVLFERADQGSEQHPIRRVFAYFPPGVC